MANVFAITISAVDRATATVRKINNSFSQLTRPVNQLRNSIKALGRELGIDKMAKSLGNVARRARDAASQVAKIGAPILALIGGGSLVGIAALAVQWARLGSEVARTSRTIGVSAGELQSYRGVANALGVSSEEMTSGFKTLGDTLQDALYGRNQDALAVLNKLGISIHKTSSGAVDSVQAFRDLSVAISNIKSPQVQGLVARTFGVEALLPILREGPVAIAKYQARVAELGAVMGPEQIRRAESFGLALNYLSLAGQGLRNTIGDALIPAFQPLVEWLTEVISANRELIHQEVGKWARDFADWVKSIDFKELWAGLQKTIKSIRDFVDSIGGWKVAAIGVALVMAGPLLLSITSIALSLTNLAVSTVPLAIKGLALLGTSLGGAGAQAGLLTAALRGVGAAGAVAFAGVAGWETGTWINNQLEKRGISIGSKIYDWVHPEEGRQHLSQVGTAKTVVDFFKGKGWSNEQAIGIAANLKKESNFDTAAVGDGGKAVGIAQWHDDRQRKFMKWAGKNIRTATLEEQMGFVNYELTQGGEKTAGDALKKATTEQQAASIVSRQYERPANADGEAAGRAKSATEMKQQLEIHLKGLPPGTTATARDNSGKNVPVNVATSMAVP
ncbi:phage tail tape measure protein [Variovorax sp. PAMC26660]|uniref:phage tail tape measure protein n=1 Tax=Variovorax sp. PAMC26660 TaxID=2762322 RepID=UPI00164EA8E6|nr:phage tail tape measure protein [Variovorax sp. PAMC26660]QNK65763.1 phage tail tape measure protein [Variovorax sp. PAMC26660]